MGSLITAARMLRFLKLTVFKGYRYDLVFWALAVVGDALDSLVLLLPEFLNVLFAIRTVFKCL